MNGVVDDPAERLDGHRAPEPTGLGAERVVFELRQDADVHAHDRHRRRARRHAVGHVGDAADFRVVDPLALRALDVNQGYGKVLHVLPDGRGVPGNPYYDAANPQSWKSRVYASGFRSPFRLSLDPASGAPVLGDVGWNTWEEVDLDPAGRQLRLAVLGGQHADPRATATCPAARA